MRPLFKKKYNNTKDLDGSKNIWNVYSNAEDIVRINLKRQHIYMCDSSHPDPVMVATLRISNETYAVGMAKSGEVSTNFPLDFFLKFSKNFLR